jgi:hypothetical protein
MSEDIFATKNQAAADAASDNTKDTAPHGADRPSGKPADHTDARPGGYGADAGTLANCAEKISPAKFPRRNRVELFDRELAVRKFVIRKYHPRNSW